MGPITDYQKSSRRVVTLAIGDLRPFVYCYSFYVKHHCLFLQFAVHLGTICMGVGEYSIRSQPQLINKS